MLVDVYMIILHLDNRVDSEISDIHFIEQKRGQFLGVTLKSTGDYFMVSYFKRVHAYVCGNN